MPSKILKTQTTELQTAIFIIQCPLFRHKIYNTQCVLFKTFSFEGFLSKSLLTKGTEFFVTNSNQSLQPDNPNILYFKLRLFDLTEIIV